MRSAGLISAWASEHMPSIACSETVRREASEAGDILNGGKGFAAAGAMDRNGEYNGA
jgi:hypothetical protein